MYGLIIDNNAGISQYQQLYEQLREKILQGFIAQSSKLASSREIASELKISRSIVLEVIDQLKVEGFLEAKRGSGTYVVPSLNYREGYSLPIGKPAKEQRDDNILSFIAGMPDLTQFPRRAWNSCYSKGIEYSVESDLSYNSAKGRYDLRETLVDYLYRFKGIKTTAEQIFITSGSAQALALLAQLDKFKSVVLEDPLATFIYDIFESQGCDISFADVDEEGIIPDSFDLKHKDLLYVSPSHQFPLGGTLSAQRRIDLLKKATAHDTLIIEDDYDGEYRYSNRPIAPFHVLSPQRVVYIGTFSKILSPALRMAYMIVPKKLVKPLHKLKSRWDLLNEGLNQLAMTSFIQEGHLEKYIRKSLRLYKLKKQVLEEDIKGILGDKWIISGNTTGLHLVIQKPGEIFDDIFKKELAEAGLRIQPVSAYTVKSKKHMDKLVLGYGNRNNDELKTGLKILKGFIDNK